MSLVTSRSPELVEVLRAAVEQGLLDLHTAMPGKIEQYNAEQQKANVKPLLQRTVINNDGTEFTEALPIIPDVPVIFPRAGGFFLSFPVAPGDFVLLVFCERSIDSYTAGTGGDTDPIDLRHHDLSDAVAFVGFAPFSQAIGQAHSENMVLGKDNNGAQIHIKNDGSIEGTFDDGRSFLVTGKEDAATMTIGDGAKHVPIVERLETLWGSMKSTMDTWGGVSGHVHSTGVGPSGPPTPALSVDNWDSSINSTKISIPDG